MSELKLIPPWDTYRNELAAIFADDPDVTVESVADFDTHKRLAIIVKSHKKFVALSNILVTHVSFGNVVMDIDLYDAENYELDGDVSDIQLFRDAFDGNPIVKDIVEMTDPAGYRHGYIVMEGRPVQFFNDDLTDYKGNFNALPEDVARELFYADWNIQFCTQDLDD